MYMNEVQLYMNIYDMKPHEPLWEVIEDKTDPPELWYKEDLINDIRENGFKNQINVDPDGNIRNGNARYWVARMLLEEENDMRFLYLPVHRGYAAGMHYQYFQMRIDPELKKQASKEVIKKIYDESVDKVTLEMFQKHMNIKEEVIPSKTEFIEYELDEDNHIFLKRHWEQSSGEYTSFIMQHPKDDKQIFCLILEGHRSYEELLADDRMKDVVKPIRDEYNSKKSKWLERQMLARIKNKK